MNRHDDSTSDRLHRMVATDEMSIGRGRSEQLARRAIARALARPVRRTLVVAVVASAFSIVGVAGLGAVANPAAPGDALYLIDRMYESVGQIVTGPVDRSEETMVEALKLMDRGRREAAVDLLSRELSVGRSLAVSEPVEEARSIVAPEETPDPALAATAPAPEETLPASSAPVMAAAAPSEPGPAVSEAAEEPEDPLRMALEYALQAKRTARDVGDDAAIAEADLAVQSVIMLAFNPADVETAAQPAAGTSTTVTTAPQKTAPGKTGTTTTTTTSVPGQDPGSSPAGGEKISGDDKGDSQEGTGGSNEPTGGGSTTGPIILPIP